MSRQGSTYHTENSKQYSSKQLGLLSINFDLNLNCVVCGIILN